MYVTLVASTLSPIRFFVSTAKAGVVGRRDAVFLEAAAGDKLLDANVRGKLLEAEFH
jgi:hypothetical protein